ncbi:hypothetical protein V6N13_110066 [Hibiscus sabdariffa]|uniref:Uncharacterized protein n=1 Tax=Hibiscus sabdariffa TaxID=183260 RepID=A0ABR2BTT3_9ROSI
MPIAHSIFNNLFVPHSREVLMSWDLLRDNMIWLVGDGNSISLCADMSWTPTSFGSYLWVPRSSPRGWPMGYLELSLFPFLMLWASDQQKLIMEVPVVFGDGVEASTYDKLVDEHWDAINPLWKTI